MSEFVSVIVPAYNSASFILDTLRSIQGQTHQHFECLICDDGSNDGTKDVVWDFARTDKRFQLHRQAENKGVAYTRNRGVSSSNADIIAICDSDDYWYPKKLEEQLQCLKASNADLVFSLCEVKNPGGRTARVYPGGIKEDMFKREAFVRALRFNVAVCGSNILWRKSAISPYKRFSRKLCPADDWDFLLWAARYCKVAFCPQYHVRYQRREESITGVHPHLPDLYLGVLQSWATRATWEEWKQWERLQSWATLLQSTLYPVYRTMNTPYDTNWEKQADYFRLQSESNKQYAKDVQKELIKARRSYAR